MIKGAISRDDILRTLEEYDDLGRDTFLDLYGFREASAYLIVHNGKEYNSKAIAGVAHKHQYGAPLTWKQFSGGVGHAVDWLKREGFTIRASRNPKWSRDELILACDVVARNDWEGLSAEDSRIAELSDLLQLLGAYPEEERASTYRNHNGAARKTFDIATHHPDYQKKRTNGGRLDREVLQDFLDRPAEMAQAAQLLREGLRHGTLQPAPPEDSDDAEDEVSAPEGRVLYRRHRTRERNKGLRTKKIAAVLKSGRTLACEACGFDFGAVYGERGEGYIECHHVVPLHEAGEGKTKLSDLALICSNCHRMIHRSAPWPTPTELRALVQRHAEAQGNTLPTPRAARESTPALQSRNGF
ncbi:HNH endonuclease [Streptomyces himastatinicus ATCC 53653]|uniref:HNH endonuclease n=1 Tax=Streptomyces himastatinicus ATCC 53653 TaxID=457427 RepID=D9W784_9ACTN|nr:HNH endonuclease [Streptomyces himastatinicus]EFL26695.1 HNH endonuclease [Streptomyces himastatinicus ATCC 53653]